MDTDMCLHHTPANAEAGTVLVKCCFVQSTKYAPCDFQLQHVWRTPVEQRGKQHELHESCRHLSFTLRPPQQPWCQSEQALPACIYLQHR